MKKKSLAITVGVIALLLAVGLGVLIYFTVAQTNAGAKTSVNRFFKDLAKYDITAMREYMDEFPSVDRQYLTYDPFSSADYVALYQAVYPDLHFKITSDTETDSTATVTLSVTHPDFSSAYATAMYSVASRLFLDPDLYDMVQDQDADLTGLIPQEIKSMYENGRIESIDTTYTLTLHKTEGKWVLQNNDELRNLMTCRLYQTAQSTIDSMTEDK